MFSVSGWNFAQAITGEAEIRICGDGPLSQHVSLMPLGDAPVSIARARGSPPKVVWLRIGNAGTEVIAALPAHNAAALDQLEADPDAALLILTAPG